MATSVDRRVLIVLALSLLLVSDPAAAQTRPSAAFKHSQSESSGPTASEVRLVRFRTSEGTWVSLDVSPDGRTIVFDLLGDLYTLPITGGQARPLTSGAAWDIQPRFSPDGHQVAFISDRTGIRNVWTIELISGHARQVSDVRYNVSDSPVSSPAWSPDGRTIVVSQRLGALHKIRLSGDHPQHGWRWLLAVYDVATRQMRWVSDTAAASARRTLGAAFGPDPETVYAAVEPQDVVYTAVSTLQPRWAIARVNLRTGAIAPEMAPRLGRAGMRPAVSRDGRFLAYASVSGSRLGLRLRDLRTYQERWLVPEKLDPASLWDAGAAGDTPDIVPGYAFTPDSKALIIAFGGKIHRIDLTTGRTQVIPFAVDVKRELAPLVVHQFSLPDTAVRTRGVLQPALSPDGRVVAFSALNRLWLMDLPPAGSPAGVPRRLTSDSIEEFFPSWSPDGAWIAYSSWWDGEGGAVRRIRVRSSLEAMPARSQRLTLDTAAYFGTAVAPDGKRVIAVRTDIDPERVIARRSDHPSSLVGIPVSGGPPEFSFQVGGGAYTSLAEGAKASTRVPVEQLYFTADSTRIWIGLTPYTLDGKPCPPAVVLADSETAIPVINDVSGVLSPDGRRGLITHDFTLSEITLETEHQNRVDTLNVEEAQSRPFGAASGAAARWGRALTPWMSWSRDGRRALFVQGGTLFVGDVVANAWTRFTRIDVPLSVPVDIPRGILVLHGARVLTMRAREVIQHADIVIRDNRILAVGRVGTVTIPRGARLLNMSGKTILPGYIDIHDHPGYPLALLPGQFWGFLVRLAYGVTTLRDPYPSQLSQNEVFTYRERERTGDLLAPRIFSTGIAHIRSDRTVETREEARGLVRPLADYFAAETFKEYSDDPWPVRRLIAAAAREEGLNATIHGDQLRAIIDGFPGIEHNISVPLYDDVLQLLARSGTTHTQTFGTTAGGSGYWLTSGREPWRNDRMHRFAPPSVRDFFSTIWLEGAVAYDAHPEWNYLYPLLRNAGALAARNGRVGMGSHGDLPAIGFHQEMWLHALGGMPPYEILRSATIVGANAIGHARDLGSLEPGKLADLQILDTNPLQDIHNTTSIRYVMKNGRLYDARDLTEIWPRHRPLSPIYLYDERPVTSGATAVMRSALKQP